MKIDVPSMRCLGEFAVTCDRCGRALPIGEERYYCLDCQIDTCSTCDACSTHRRVPIPAFGELTDPAAVLGEAAEYLGAACGRCAVRDEIYLGRVQSLLEFLGIRTRDAAAAARVLANTPPPVQRFIEQHGADWLRRWVSLRRMGRFVDYPARRAIAGRLPDYVTWMHSQGSYGPTMWRGKPMMRTVWDFALSAVMFHEIRPRTVIEIGTGSGGSAIWYADLQRTVGLTPRVWSIDIDPPSLEYDGVTFLRGDSNYIAGILPYEMMTDWTHPWLLIEDAHVNIGGILEHFHAVTEPGDYLAIEDVDAEHVLAAFLARYPTVYKVDARYTDYFGHNTTCCADQILRRMGQYDDSSCSDRAGLGT